MRLLIVRLGALGDIVHTIPAAAALRRAFPEARIDWAAEAAYAPFLSLVQPIDRVIPLEGRSIRAWADLARRLRRASYDAALDFQGLMKSAVLARASGARRVLGFSIRHLREKGARPFYSHVPAGGEPAHVIQKNLGLLSTVGVQSSLVEFPIASTPSRALDAVLHESAETPIALINPGANWPNKRWPPLRFGQVAAFLREARGLQPYVLWAPDERELAQAVVDASRGGARMAPPTTIVDLVELARHAAIVVSGDTGPLHIAAAVGAPAVGIFGPTNPARNGPWASADLVVSRYGSCGCHYRRRCRQQAWCLDDVGVGEVTAAIQQRLAAARAAGSAE